MKGVLAILLVVTGHYMVLAQNKHNLYLDVGVNNPGISATYDRKLTKHFDIGAGISAYNFNDAQYGNIRSALYADFRPYWVIRKNLLFTYGDIGLAAYGGRDPNAATLAPLGVYTGFGFGYGYRINKRGMAPYVSLGLNGYTQTVHYNNTPLTPNKPDYGFYDGTLQLSLGFKF